MFKLYVFYVIVLVVEFVKYIYNNYFGFNFVFESYVVYIIYKDLLFFIYLVVFVDVIVLYVDKIDLVIIMGGDGIILCVVSFFLSYFSVLLILVFSMGIFGFFGEWKFDEYKWVFWECYMSGCSVLIEDFGDFYIWIVIIRVIDGLLDFEGWDSVWGNGKCMGLNCIFKIFFWNWLWVGIYDSEGCNINEYILFIFIVELFLGFEGELVFIV